MMPQVVQETGQPEGTELSFTGMLFQPVPWSMQTKKGMPAEFEKYAADPDYVIINTPPNFMFQVRRYMHPICMSTGSSEIRNLMCCVKRGAVIALCSVHRPKFSRPHGSAPSSRGNDRKAWDIFMGNEV